MLKVFYISLAFHVFKNVITYTCLSVALFDFVDLNVPKVDNL